MKYASGKFTICLGQMDVQLGQPRKNLEKVEQLTYQARNRNADLLLLPELWSTGYDLEHCSRHAADTESGIFAKVSALARDNKIAILGSNLSIAGVDEYANTAVYFNEEGSNIGEYSKIHLFGLLEEPEYLSPGNQLAVVDTRVGKAGIAICYDLRFPELFRAYALRGASMILLPAEWPWPRLSHWRTLIQARAIENQLFVAACNQVGTSREETFFGHSMIADPWGEIVVEGGEEEELLTAEIDPGMIHSVRAKIPVFVDRRPGIYDSDDDTG